jgi:hypothetical protein
VDKAKLWKPGGLGNDAPESPPELKHMLHDNAFLAMGRFAIATVARYIAPKAR